MKVEKLKIEPGEEVTKPMTRRIQKPWWFSETMIHAQQFYQRWPQMTDNNLYDPKWHTEPLYFSFQQQQQQQQQQSGAVSGEVKPLVSDTSSSCDSSPNSGGSAPTMDAVFPSTSLSSQMEYHNRMNAAAAAACYPPNFFNGFMDYPQQFAWQSASLHRMEKASSPGGKMLPTGPGTNNYRVRTADKYRMVYSDYQRLELEKEFHTSAFINADRKTQLSTALNLTERQIKIWFQNRRAKDRRDKQKVKMM